MEKSISSRFYFDYNATSPLAKKVIDFLHNGEFFFGNPSSIHSTGKQARKQITDTKNYLYSTFNLSESDFDLVFNSGATESINTFFKGNALLDYKNNQKSVFYFSTVDHAAVNSLESDLKILGREVRYFEVDKNGEFDLLKLISKINEDEKNNFKVYLNFTYINNESGVVWPLDLALQIKSKTKAIIHVDAVQLVGKISNWNLLKNSLDAYTFSAHKFGALKGIGFIFINKKTSYHPTITGGSQQESRRSGTENAMGVYSIKLALEEINSKFNETELMLAKNFIEQQIVESLGSKGEVIGVNAKSRNLNTIFFIIYGSKAELISMKFDMALMDVSTGSACSSGIIKENRIIQSMGYSDLDARSCIRLSFSTELNQSDAKIYSEKILSVIKNSLS